MFGFMQMKKFKVTWVQGYACSSNHSEEHDLEEIFSWNLSPYLGDDYKKFFENIKVGETKTVYGPCGIEEVTYERIK